MKLLKKLTLILTVFASLGALAFESDKAAQETVGDSLISDWGDSALTFDVLKDDYDLEALGFPLLSSNITSLNTLPDSSSKRRKLSSLFHNDSFSAESGFAEKVIDKDTEQAFFLQGSYQVMRQEKFSLVLTAKIESLHEQSIYQFYSNDFVNHEAASPVNSIKSYARLGLLGQFSINEHWHLVGGITSTAHDNSEHSNLVYQNKTEQVALFGTTYTF